MNSIKKYIPKGIKKAFKSSGKPVKKKVELMHCSVCHQEVILKPFSYDYYFRKFYENDFVYSPFQFETLNLKHYSCSNCNASDRDRLMALFIDKHIKEHSTSTLKVLDFAPAKSLQTFLKSFQNVSYRSADLYMEDVDDKVDITNMEAYEDNTFDMFICSHVLEHIERDDKAMSELFRVTKEGGVGVCLVPIMLSLESSVENKEYLDDVHLRWKYFGQNDHVRMYSKNDFVSRLKAAGFKVEQCDQNYFGAETFENNGINYKSVLYIVKK